MSRIAFNAAIDDLDLSPTEFRVYCHILRRGDCWESIGQAAKHCRISESTYRRTVQRLVYTHQLVSFQERSGQTTIYRAIPLADQKGLVMAPATPPKSDTPPLADLTPPPASFDTPPVPDLTGVPLADLTPKVLPREVEQRKEEANAANAQLQNQDAFQAVARIVKSEVGFLTKRSFNFEQASGLWGDLLPKLWGLCLRAPNRKPGDQPIYRFKDACERKLDLGLEPPASTPPPTPPAGPDENGIVLGKLYWQPAFGEQVRPIEWLAREGAYACETPGFGSPEPIKGRIRCLAPHELEPLETAQRVTDPVLRDRLGLPARECDFSEVRHHAA